MNHELALQKALIAHLTADAAVQTLLGDRLWDAAPDAPTYPHLLIGRSESRSLPAEGGAIEHLLALTVVSRFQGAEEAKAAAAAIRSRLGDAPPGADGIRIASLGVRFTDVWRSPTGPRTYAVMRVRAVTEEI